MDKDELIKLLEGHIKEEIEFLNKLDGKEEPIYGLLNLEKLPSIGCIKRNGTSGKRGEFNGNFKPNNW